MGSTRLPGKVLMPFYGGKTLIATLLDTLHGTGCGKVVVATSVNGSDDPLAEFLLERGETVFRGSETDVLGRFIGAAEAGGIDGIVRVCSDNPFIDRDGIVRLVEKAEESVADYIGFRVGGKPSILTHFGFWGEFVRLSALRRVAETTEEGTPAREHVTIHIYTHPDEYRCEWIPAPDFLQNRDDIRLTIDTREDFTNAAKAYSTLKARKGGFTLEDVVEYIDSDEDMRRSMKSEILRNRK